MLTLSLESSETLLSVKYRDLVVRYTDPQTGVAADPLYFNIRTYDKIAGTSATANGEAILSPLVRFVENLPERNQKILHKFYESVHGLFAALDVKEDIEPADHANLIATLFNLTNDMVEKIGLCRKLQQFVTGPEFVYPDNQDAGGRYYHSTEMTFDNVEVRDMTALSMLFKVMIPVWGEYIAHFDIFDINPIYREQKALEIVEDVLENSALARTYRKFTQYAENIVRREIANFNKDQNRTISTEHIFSFHNLTDSVFTDVIEATILLKKTVLYECGTIKPDGGISAIMVYICAGLVQSARTLLITLSKTVSILPLNEQDQREGEENNQSAMEYYSKTSDRPADYPVFIEVMMEREIPKIAHDFKVPMQHVDALTDYYLHHPFEFGPLAYSCVASLVGDRVGGSQSLQMPQYREIAKLVAITQHFMARNGMDSLVPFLSCKSSQILIDVDLDADLVSISRIKEGLNVDLDYAKLLENYSGFTEKTVTVEKKKRGKKTKTDVMRIDIERQVTRLITWCISQPHVANTPGSFWDLYPNLRGPAVGSAITVKETLLRDLCRFYRFFHDKANPIAWE